MSNCKSRQLGCVLQCKDGNIFFGWNGPPSGVKECDTCPRKVSGKDLDKCRAVHAERRALLAAAKAGVSTVESILYCDFGPPCKDCLVELIESGVQEIVCTNETYYDKLSPILMTEWVNRGGVFRVI